MPLRLRDDTVVETLVVEQSCKENMVEWKVTKFVDRRYIDSNGGFLFIVMLLWLVVFSQPILKHMQPAIRIMKPQVE